MKAGFVVIGAGVAGVRAAAALRAGGFDGRVVLIGGEPHRPYDRPPLSKELLKGVQSPADIRLHREHFYLQNDIDLSLGTEVVRLLPAERRVVLDTGKTLHADKVLLCTGGAPRRLDVPGSHLEGVRYLRTLDDALAIRAQLAGGDVVVVGAGFIGAEVAAAAREGNCRVTLLEVAPVPLAHTLGEHIGGVYAELHRQRGVDLRTGVGVAKINGTERVREVVTTDGRTIPADLVVVGIGMNPDTRLADEAGIAVGNGIVVDEYGQTSVDAVFAAGDVANRLDRRTGKHVRLEHWQSAQRHAVATANSMLGELRPFSEVPWFWSDQYGINLQTAGQPLAGTRAVIRGDIEDLSFTAFYLHADRLTGVIGVNRPRDVRAAMSLIEHGIPVKGSVLSDTSVDLRRLAKRSSSVPALEE